MLYDNGVLVELFVEELSRWHSDQTFHVLRIFLEDGYTVGFLQVTSMYIVVKLRHHEHDERSIRCQARGWKADFREFKAVYSSTETSC